jgi:pyruvate/2-oxoacid:ferredoxin oxidoreductase alpha subunit
VIGSEASAWSSRSFKYRNPVVVLADGYLGQMTGRVQLPDHMVVPVPRPDGRGRPVPRPARECPMMVT